MSTNIDLVDSIMADLHSAAMTPGGGEHNQSTETANSTGANDRPKRATRGPPLPTSVLNDVVDDDDDEHHDQQQQHHTDDDEMSEMAIDEDGVNATDQQPADESGAATTDANQSFQEEQPYILLEREPGSQMVVRYNYDTITRRALLPADISLANFKTLVHEKTGQSFEHILYYHRNTLVDIIDEDEFSLAVASAYEPHFMLRHAGELTTPLRFAHRTPPVGDYANLLGDTPNSPLMSTVSSALTPFDASILTKTPTDTARASRVTGHVVRGRVRRRRLGLTSMLSFYQLRTVRRLWKEYAEGIDGCPSIRSMDEEHGPSWRRDQYQSYQRRMRIVKEIQRRGAEIGINAAIEELESIGSLHKVTEALRTRHMRTPEGQQRRERVLRGMQRRRERIASGGEEGGEGDEAGQNLGHDEHDEHDEHDDGAKSLLTSASELAHSLSPTSLVLNGVSGGDGVDSSVKHGGDDSTAVAAAIDTLNDDEIAALAAQTAGRHPAGSDMAELLRHEAAAQHDPAAMTAETKQARNTPHSHLFQLAEDANNLDGVSML